MDTVSGIDEWDMSIESPASPDLLASRAPGGLSSGNPCIDLVGTVASDRQQGLRDVERNVDHPL